MSRAQLYVLNEGLVDSVGLWEIVRAVRVENPNAGDAEVQSLTLEVLRDLLVGGYVTTGHPRADGSFVPSAVEPTEAIRQIAKDWISLGRDPDIGEVAWISTTERGSELARGLGAAEGK